MDEILHHLGWLKPYKQWDNHHPWWCRILSINSNSQHAICNHLQPFANHNLLISQILKHQNSRKPKRTKNKKTTKKTKVSRTTLDSGLVFLFVKNVSTKKTSLKLAMDFFSQNPKFTKALRGLHGPPPLPKKTGCFL